MLFLSTVWPEPRSSAAGVRTAALLRAFARAGYSLSVGASASPNTASEALEREGVGNPVTCFSVPLNSSAALDAALEASSPSVVVFDRFTSEEAFSWRVREKAPQAARVLDMQDYHALRRARARAVEEAGRKGEDAAAVSAALVARIDTSDRDAIREASAVFRSDLTLVCSPVEREILSASLGAGLAKAKLVPAPLFASRPALGPGRRPGFGARTHFVAIGSFLHPPNVDSLLWLAGRRRRPDKKKGKARTGAAGPPGDGGGGGSGGSEVPPSTVPIWDLITSHPGTRSAELHIYGSYASKSAAAAEIHDPKRGVFVHGLAPNLSPLARARVLLAPLRFGAGLKGKVTDAWMRGTPVVTTPIGAEGMAEEGGEEEEEEEEEEEGREEEVEVSEDGRRRGRKKRGSPLLLPWGGSRTSETASAFAAEAIRLYLDENAWKEASEEGLRLHDALYFTPRPADAAVAAVDALLTSDTSSSSGASLISRRARDFVGASLWADSARATEYFSRWIELKEKDKEKKV